MNAQLRYGYTLADIHALARFAVHLAGDMASDWRDRYDVAYSAIAEAIYAATDHPTRQALLTAGRVALYRMVRAHHQTYGYYRAHDDGNAHGVGSSPSFRAYWLAPEEAPFEEGLIERQALAQILTQLSKRELEALYALAALDDYHAAAESMGVGYVTYKSMLSKARAKFRAFWHQGESPSRQWGTDRRCGVSAGTRRIQGSAVQAIRRNRRLRAVRNA